MKKVFTLICLILASIIGAGFASGKEIEVFFSRYGTISIIAIALSFILFVVLLILYLTFGKKYNTNNLFETNQLLFGKCSIIINCFVFVSYSIVLSGMLAGVYELYLNISNPVIAKLLVLVTAVLCVIENSGGMKSIYLINNIFIPITIIILIVSACIKGNGIYCGDILISLDKLLPCSLSAICYVSINLMLTGNILIKEGKKYTKRQIIVSAVISSFILVVIIFLFNNVILDMNISSQMPMLTLAFNINYWWGIVVLICIWFCVYSAITSITYILADCFGGNNAMITNLIIITISYIISLFGFGKIVEYLYPIIGVFGILFSCAIIFKLVKKSSTMPTAMQNIKKLENKAKNKQY